MPELSSSFSFIYSHRAIEKRENNSARLAYPTEKLSCESHILGSTQLILRNYCVGVVLLTASALELSWQMPPPR